MAKILNSEYQDSFELEDGECVFEIREDGMCIVSCSSEEFGVEYDINMETSSYKAAEKHFSKMKKIHSKDL